jgi:tetratricopeptide (TPR) repeat protein
MMSRAVAGSQLSDAEKMEAARLSALMYMASQPPDYEKAIAMTKLVLKARPDNIEALNNLACMLVDSVRPPRPAEALTYSQHAYNLMQQSGAIQPLVQDTQGWVLLNNGKIDEATMLLRQVVDNNPFLDAYYHLAEAYLRNNQPLAAKQQLTLASQLLENLKKDNKPYDQTLPARIQAATEQAQQMLKMQASTPQ